MQNNANKIMNNSSGFKTQILWKVYLVWFFRRILPLVALEVLVLGAAVYFLARFIFVEKVISNTLAAAANNPLVIFTYLFYAFLGTTLINKVLIIALLSIGALLLRDIGRTLVSYRMTSKVAKPNP